MRALEQRGHRAQTVDLPTDQPELGTDDYADTTTDASVAARLVYHDCDEQTLEWALTTRRLFVPVAALNERIALHREVPSTYIVATEDRTIRPDWQRRMARDRLGVEPIEIPSGHCPNVSQPDRLAKLLLGAC